MSLLVSGLWNNFAKLALPVVALALLALQGNPSGGRVVAGLLGLVALVAAVVAAGDAAVQRAGGRPARPGRGPRWPARCCGSSAGRRCGAGTGPRSKFRYRTITLLKARWPWITAATLLSHLSLYLVLLVALRFLGVSDAEVGWAEVLAVFAFARLLTAIPFTPAALA